MEIQHAGGRDTLVAALDEVTRLCQETRIREVGLSQAVELLTAMKRAARFLDGAKLAAIGHIEQLQAQRQAQFDQLPEGNGGNSPGDQRNLGEALTSSGQQSKAQTGRELRPVPPWRIRVLERRCRKGYRRPIWTSSPR